MKTINKQNVKLAKLFKGHYRGTTNGMYITIEQNLCTSNNYWTLTIYKGNEKSYMFSEELFSDRYDRKKDCMDVARYQVGELTK